MEKDTKKIKKIIGLCIKISGWALLAAYAILMIFGRFMFSPLSGFWRSINFFGTAGEYNTVLRILSYVIFCFVHQFICDRAKVRLGSRQILMP